MMRVACLLARDHGLAVLRALVDSAHRVVAVFTHRRKPRSEDAGRGDRPEYAAYAELCARSGIPLWSVDSREEADALLVRLESAKPDVIVVCSWRRYVTEAELRAARKGGVNLHRGQLPDFAGAEPIRRALEAGRSDVVVTAHVMTELVDSGEVLAERRLTVRRSDALERDVERIKCELTPLFGPLALEALERVDRRASLDVAGPSCLIYQCAEPLPLDRVVVRIQDAEELRPRAHECDIAAAWKELQARNPRAFNGRLANLLSVETPGGDVVLNGNRIDYRTYIGVSSRPGYRLFDSGVAAMGSSCLLITSDEKVIFARRGKGLSGEGRWLTVPGGLCTLDEAAFSLSRHVEVEGDEELGIPRADLGEVRFLGIGYDAAVARGAEVLLRIRTPLAAAEIIRRHASARDGHESTHLRAVPVEAAGDFVLARAGEVLGGAAAAVAAWLSHLGHAEESRTVATAQKSPPVKAVVFDLDGVLIDSLQAHYEAWCEFLSPHGVNYSWGDFEQDIGPSTAELMERWIRRLSLGISVKEGVKRKEALFTERLKSRAVVFPGVAEGLGRLSAVPLAVATSAGRALTEAVLEAAGIGRAFRHVITSDDVPRTKPSPDVYRLAAKRLGVPAWVCAAVEDSPSGIEAAQAAGMRVIGVAGSFDRARLEPADRIVASTAEACRFLESEIRPS